MSQVMAVLIESLVFHKCGFNLWAVRLPRAVRQVISAYFRRTIYNNSNPVTIRCELPHSAAAAWGLCWILF